jgi:hypothetical protein
MSGEKRTNELQRSIPGVSQKVLIQQLRELESNKARQPLANGLLRLIFAFVGEVV